MGACHAGTLPFSRYKYQKGPGRDRASAASKPTIVTAIERRDAEEAERLMRAHIAAAR
ncbi:MAG TPA: FCD domain-containing protein [Terriglobia bacterium]|nr:FCD domain-containing protein [Terriglobia bacterium]